MNEHQPNLTVFYHFLKRIFTRQLKPGDKLPPLRQLAKEMNIDQASMRIVLKQLESMNVLGIRRGDGVYVKDYMKSGGLDFLSAIFQYQQEHDEEMMVDEYLMDDVCSFWVAILPEIFHLASRRYSAGDIKVLIGILDQEQENVGDLPRLVDLEMEMQDRAADVANNIVTSLLFNTLRPIRRKVTELFILSYGEKEYIDCIIERKNMLKAQLAGTESDNRRSVEEYRNVLKRSAEAIRRSMVEERPS